MRLNNGGVAFDLPTGWEGQIDGGAGSWEQPVAGDGAPVEVSRQPGGPTRRTVAHAANFPLPATRGDFGNGAVQTMHAGDAFIALFEYDPESASAALFDHEGMPVLAAGDFDPAFLQKPVPGGSAVQRFFRHNGRAFCLYVVVGSHIDRRDVLPDILAILAAVEIA